uniref:mannosyl-oligosaccharide 1,2-alpha-mannosidase n=1 Tax=Macrostomum lignano TaxID=282301 RepID=A0A1I8F6S4_9PLAT
YYEYLIKQFVQAGKSRSFEYLRDDWAGRNGRRRQAPSGARVPAPPPVQVRRRAARRHHLLAQDGPPGLLPAGALAYGFLHGMPPRGAPAAGRAAHAALCYITYTTTATGLAPEITHFNTDAASVADTYVKPLDRHNIQRPETVESLFYMWRVTGSTKLGWAIFQAFEKYTKVQPAGYVSISDVTNARNPGKRDQMRVVLYFFLLFSEDNDLLPLDNFTVPAESELPADCVCPAECLPDCVCTGYLSACGLRCDRISECLRTAKQSGGAVAEFYRESMQSLSPRHRSRAARAYAGEALNGLSGRAHPPEGAAAAGKAPPQPAKPQPLTGSFEPLSGLSTPRWGRRGPRAARKRGGPAESLADASWQQQEKDSDQQAASAVDVRGASQVEQGLDNSGRSVLPAATEAAHQLARLAAAGRAELRSSGPPFLTSWCGSGRSPRRLLRLASGDIELADEGIATMTLRQPKSGGGGGGSGGRVVHPRGPATSTAAGSRGVAATAAATAAVAMAEPLIRGQQQVEANIGRLLERLERLEARRGCLCAGGQQPKQEEERRLREQLGPPAGRNRLSQPGAAAQREQLRMQQELLMQQHRMPMGACDARASRPPPPPPTPTPAALVDERASVHRPQARRPAGESTRKSPAHSRRSRSHRASDRAAQVVSDIRDEVRCDRPPRGDSELGGACARLLNEIDSIRSDIRAHKDRYQAMPPAEATATTSAGSPADHQSPPDHQRGAFPPDYQSSPAMSAIEPPADRSTPAVSLSGLSRFEINGAGSGARAGARRRQEKKRPPLLSLNERSGAQQEAAGSHKQRTRWAARQRTLLEVRRRQPRRWRRAPRQPSEAAMAKADLQHRLTPSRAGRGGRAEAPGFRAIVDDVIKHGRAHPSASGAGARKNAKCSSSARRGACSEPIRAIFLTTQYRSQSWPPTVLASESRPSSGQRAASWALQQRMPRLRSRHAGAPHPTSAVPKSAEPKPPQTREEAVQAGSPPRDDRRDDGTTGDDEDGASVEGAGVRLPGYHRPPPRRPAPPTGPSRRRPSLRRGRGRGVTASRSSSRRPAPPMPCGSRMRDEVLAEVLARMVDQAQARRQVRLQSARTRLAWTRADPAHDSLRAALPESNARRDDWPPPGGAAFFNARSHPRDDEQPETATESTPTQRNSDACCAAAAEPSVPLSALQLLLQQRPEPPPHRPPPPQPQPSRSLEPRPPFFFRGIFSESSAADQTAQKNANFPTRTSSACRRVTLVAHSRRPSLDGAVSGHPAAAASRQTDRPTRRGCLRRRRTPCRHDPACAGRSSAASPRCRPSRPTVPPKTALVTAATSSPDAYLLRTASPRAVWLLDRSSEGQAAPNIQVATEARQLLRPAWTPATARGGGGGGGGRLRSPPPTSLWPRPAHPQRGRISRRAPLHAASAPGRPPVDPVLAVIAGSDGRRPLYPPPPGRRHRSGRRRRCSRAARARTSPTASAGSSLSEPGGPDNSDDVHRHIGRRLTMDAELRRRLFLRRHRRPRCRRRSSSAQPSYRPRPPEARVEPSEPPPAEPVAAAQRDSLQLRTGAARRPRPTAIGQLRRRYFHRGHGPRRTWTRTPTSGLSSTATNLLSHQPGTIHGRLRCHRRTRPAWHHRAAAPPDGPNCPGLDPRWAGASPFMRPKKQRQRDLARRRPSPRRLAMTTLK